MCISPLKLWIRFPLMAMCTRYNIMWSKLTVSFSGTPVSYTNEIYLHDITEISMKVALSTIIITPQMDNQKPYIEGKTTTHWPKWKGKRTNNYLQSIAQKTKRLSTNWTPLNTGGDPGYIRRVSSAPFIRDTAWNCLSDFKYGTRNPRWSVF